MKSSIAAKAALFIISSMTLLPFSRAAIVFPYPIEAGAVTELTFLGEAGDATWINNSEILYFGGCGLSIANLRSQEIQCVLNWTKLPDLSFERGRLSRDGRRLVFDGSPTTGAPGGFVNIWSLDVAGGDLIQLTHDNRSWGPTWSPSGDVLAYASGSMNIAGTAPHGIWVMRFDGSGARALTVPPENMREFNPAWSPDGRVIAYFVVNESIYPNRYAVWQVDANGTRNEPIVSGLPVDTYTGGGTLSWAPDSRILAVAADFSVLIVNADNVPAYVLLQGSATSPLSDPAISPDGKRLLFTFTNYTSRVTHTSRIHLAQLTISNITDNIVPSSYTLIGHPASRPELVVALVLGAAVVIVLAIVTKKRMARKQSLGHKSRRRMRSA